MKYVATASFRADYARLSDSEKELFRKALRSFNDACDRYAADPRTRWPSALRVKDVEGAPGVFEMTWSFSGPEGRATFEWTRVDGALAVRWRRLGGHSIFSRP